MRRSPSACSTGAASALIALLGAAAASAQPASPPAEPSGPASKPAKVFAEPEEGRVRIVLVTNHADAEIMPLLRSELEEMGIDVQVVDRGENEVVPRDLGRAARRAKAVAGIRVIVAESVVEVWVADRVTGKVTLREIITQPSQTVSDRTTVVIRAVELLRVSLMELETPHGARGDLEPPQELARIAGFPESRGVFGMDAGAGVLWASPDLGPWPIFYAGVRARVHDVLHLSVFAAPSLVAATVEGPEGIGFVRPHLFAAGLRVSLAETTALVQPAFGLSTGVLWFSMRGEAVPPRVDFTENVVSPVLLASGHLPLRLSNAFRIWIASEGGLSFRPAEVAFGDRVVATMSRALITGMAGLEVAVP